MPRGHLASQGTGEGGATKLGSPNRSGGSWGGFGVCLSNSETLLPARRKSCHRHPQRAIKSDFPSRCRLVPPLGFSPLCKHTHTLTRQGGLKIGFGWPLGRFQAIREVKARLALALNLGRWREARTHATAKLPLGWLCLFFLTSHCMSPGLLGLLVNPVLNSSCGRATLWLSQPARSDPRRYPRGTKITPFPIRICSPVPSQTHFYWPRSCCEVQHPPSPPSAVLSPRSCCRRCSCDRENSCMRVPVIWS